MLAGILFGAFGAGALLITASTYVVSIVSLGFVRLRRAAAARRDEAALNDGRRAGRRGAVRDWLAGFRFLYKEPVFRSLTLLMGAYAFLSTGTLDLIIFHVREDLGQSDQTVGVVFGLASVGAIVAGVLATRIRHHWGFGPVFAAAFVVQGLMTIFIGLSGAVLVIVLIAIVYSFADTTRGTTTMTLRQELTPDHLLGRVTAAFWIAFSVPGPLGAAVLTAIAERAGAGASLVGIGLVGMAIGTVSIFTPAGQRRPRLVGADAAEGVMPADVVVPSTVE
jgi:MFS family permease